MYRLEAENLFAKGKKPAAEKALSRAEKLSENAIRVGADVAETAIARNRLGLCYQVRGAALNTAGDTDGAADLFDKAGALHQDALMTFEDIGDKYRVAQILGDLGEIAFLKGSDHDAVVHLKNSLTLFRQLGSGYHIAKVLVKLGSLGRGEERLGYFSEALTAARRHNRESFGEIGTAIFEAMEEDVPGREKLFADLGPDFDELYGQISELVAAK